jgi:hypothetical protein
VTPTLSVPVKSLFPNGVIQTNRFVQVRVDDRPSAFVLTKDTTLLEGYFLLPSTKIELPYCKVLDIALDPSGKPHVGYCFQPGASYKVASHFLLVYRRVLLENSTDDTLELGDTTKYKYKLGNIRILEMGDYANYIGIFRPSRITEMLNG